MEQPHSSQNFKYYEKKILFHKSFLFVFLFNLSGINMVSLVKNYKNIHIKDTKKVTHYIHVYEICTYMYKHFIPVKRISQILYENSKLLRNLLINQIKDIKVFICRIEKILYRSLFFYRRFIPFLVQSKQKLRDLNKFSLSVK